MMSNLKKRSYDFSNRNKIENYLSKDNEILVDNFLLNENKWDYNKKKIKNNHIEEGKIQNDNIFCKLKDFYKIDNGKTLRHQTDKSSEYKLNRNYPSVITKFGMVGSGLNTKICTNNTSYVLEKDILENSFGIENKKFSSKEKKTNKKNISYERIFSKSQNNSKTKLKNRIRNKKYTRKYSYTSEECNDEIVKVKNVINRNNFLNTPRKCIIEKTDMKNYIKEVVDNEYNLCATQNMLKHKNDIEHILTKSTKNEELKTKKLDKDEEKLTIKDISHIIKKNIQNDELINHQTNIYNTSIVNITSEESGINEISKRARTKEKCAYKFVDNYLNHTPTVFDICKKRYTKMEKNKKVFNEHNIQNSIKNCVDETNYGVIKNETDNTQITIFSKYFINKDELNDEIKENRASNNDIENINYNLKEKPVNEYNKHGCIDKLCFSDIQNKVSMYDEQVYHENDYNNISGNKYFVKYLHKKNDQDNLKDNIVEKREKIKSIHSDFLKFIDSDNDLIKWKNGNCCDSILVNNSFISNHKEEKIHEMAKIEEIAEIEKNKSGEIYLIGNKNLSINSNEINENSSKYDQEKAIGNGIIDEINKINNKNNFLDKKAKNDDKSPNLYPYENNLSKSLLKCGEDFDKIQSYSRYKDNKKELSIMGGCVVRKKEEITNSESVRIETKKNLGNNYLNKLKLIYKKEKKILEVNVKYVERYLYFKVILSTYSKNNIIYMNEHNIDFKLSKVLFYKDIVKKINKRNFKSIMKSLDFYGYMYNNIFLKKLYNRININKWLYNKNFFNQIFTKDLLQIELFYDLVYQFLYMDVNFINFFFTKNGGNFIKSFYLYHKKKSIKLMNKLIMNLNKINPNTDDVVDFLYAFFSQGNETTTDGEYLRQNKEKGKSSRNNNEIKESNIEEYVILKSSSSMDILDRSIKKYNNNRRKKKCKNSHIYIKYRKFKKSLLRNVLNKIWSHTDIYIKEEVYYDQNFIIRKKIKKKKKSEQINNIIYHNCYTTNESSDYTYVISDEEQQYYSLNKSHEININEKANETIYTDTYNQNIISENPENFGINYQENNYDDENYESVINNNNININNNSIKRVGNAFHSLDSLPNVSLDLYSIDSDDVHKNDYSISLCLKEEEKCNVDKFIKDISHIGIRISLKENKINYFNCFDVNLKVKIKNHLLSNINYNISNDGDHVSAFLPIWPRTPDYFGYKIGRNIKKGFNIIKENIKEGRGYPEDIERDDIIFNRMNDKTRDNINGKKDDVCNVSTNWLSKYDELNKLKNKGFDWNKINNNIHDNEYNNIFMKDNYGDKNQIKNVDEIKIKDCCYILNIKIYPLRTLALYVLYNSIYKDKNIKFVKFYSNSINKEIREWLLLFLLPNFINKCIHKVTYPLKLTKNIFSESSEYYEDFFSNEYSKVNDIEKIIIYTKNNSDEQIEICPFFFCYIWLKSTKSTIDKWVSSKINEILFTFPFSNFLLSKYFSGFVLFIQLFHICLDIDHMYLCKSHFYVSLKHNISFLHESLVNVLFSKNVLKMEDA
ncbi:hypothetical protein [Plasmodium yoelii yoelii]|uniref:Uncharacterized protein n=3 Tax=Plasmodium yoelii TaxID=5861 RepID=A0AAF0B6Y5_PLAYO|nr:hypothetical protein [Plasmodium yoelii yoelii]WBY58830.1 hypothetical protein Py17XNL_001105795 [Plasmodium yoelii yoelii]